MTQADTTVDTARTHEIVEFWGSILTVAPQACSSSEAETEISCDIIWENCLPKSNFPEPIDGHFLYQPPLPASSLPTCIFPFASFKPLEEEIRYVKVNKSIEHKTYHLSTDSQCPPSLWKGQCCHESHGREARWSQVGRGREGSLGRGKPGQGTLGTVFE